MNHQNFKKHIEDILKADTRLWYQETHEDGTKTTKLDQILLIDLAEKHDARILSLLFADETLKEKFFVKIGESYVFRNRDFQFFLEENKVDNSYTKYKNRIGLSDGKRFLKDNKEVVLNFPFKDCTLEGGQSTEEGQDSYFEIAGQARNDGHSHSALDAESPEIYNQKQAKRKEIFFNEILAADEIDRLKDEKALVNWQRFDVDDKNVGTDPRVCPNENGQTNLHDGQTHRFVPTEIKRDQNGTIKENLIIKGNNLLALYSLKKQFAKKIKLIYIDPPYNTGGDANIFTYNNNFNHSTWLTFMKNRLEVARELLREDGFIAIAIDHCELGYLIVLADEIFGRENRLGIITVVHNAGGRPDATFFSVSNEYMLVYAKNKSYAKLKNFDLPDEKSKKYRYKDDKGFYKLDIFHRASHNSNREDRPNLFYPIFYSKEKNILSTIKKENFIEIYPIDNHGNEKCWRWSKERTQENIEELVIKKIKNQYRIFAKSRLENNKGDKPRTFWNDSKYSGSSGSILLSKLLGHSKPLSFPKSLYTILDTLKLTTEKDDIILDFHAGSGTTGHAVLALNKEDGGNRKFILVEQLDQHIDICKERIQKVLEKENINDSFVYCEIAKWNEQAREQILACQSLEQLKTFFSEMVDKYFLNYNLKIKEFQEKVLQEDEFKNLPLNKQKEIFITMLDNNQMYVCRSEMEDAKFGISEEDIEMTREFYGNNN